MRSNVPRLRICGFVVFGLDGIHHPRAGWFDPGEAAAARAAAARNGFVLYEVTRETPRGLEDWLPLPRRLETGRLALPRIRMGLFAKLIELDEEAQGRSPAHDDNDDVTDPDDAALDWLRDERS